MNKRIFNDSFNYGTDQDLLVFIADDPDVLRKRASSSVVDEWGDIDPIKGHSLVHLTALGDFEKTGVNQNGDAFEAWVCRLLHPTFRKNGALYRNHKAVKGKEEGFVLKTAHNDVMGRTELLIAARMDKCADWLSDLDRGEAVKFSMGFACDHDVCSRPDCGNKAKTRAEYCRHVKKGARYPDGMGVIRPDGGKNFVFNREGFFNDISRVPVGADQIAMDLRKVAGLDGSGEVIGGAELAEMYFNQHGDADLAKIALCRKLSMIEKRIEATGMGRVKSRTRTLSKAASGPLRAAPPAEMFRELAKLGALLPVREFYSLVMGDEYSEYEAAIEKTAAVADGMFSRICADHDRLVAVCSNETYSPGSRSHVALSKQARREVASSFSIDPELASVRAIERSVSGEPMPKVAGDFQSDFLLDQYAAYKIAALSAIPVSLTESTLFAVLLDS